MTVNVFDGAAEVAEAAAHRVASEIRGAQSIVLGLPAGRTPVATYAALQRLHEARDLDFSGVRTFALDEFAGLSGAHPASFQSFLRSHLLDRVNIDPSRTHFLNGTAADLDDECRAYERAIERAGGIDLLLLGIGSNAHVAFNEPGDALVAATHRVALRMETRRDNAHLFGTERDVPAEALTMGMGTILKARSIVLIATGTGKSQALARAVLGPLTTRVPASLLQGHGRVEFYLDREAASELAGAGRSAPLRTAF